MTLCTSSEVISLARDMENDSAGYYRALHEKFGDAEIDFSKLAGENLKNIVQIERVYFSVISDALEGCFAFQIEPDKYSLKLESSDLSKLPEVLSCAIDMEKIIARFYSEAAEQSQSLMADIPRVFIQMATKRKTRISMLENFYLK
jgi:rubrerythrin